MGGQKIHENYDSLFQNPLLVYVSKIKNYICKKYEKGRRFLDNYSSNNMLFQLIIIINSVFQKFKKILNRLLKQTVYVSRQVQKECFCGGFG